MVHSLLLVLAVCVAEGAPERPVEATLAWVLDWDGETEPVFPLPEYIAACTELLARKDLAVEPGQLGFRRGMAHLAKGDYPEAERDLAESLLENEKNWPAAVGLARARLNMETREKRTLVREWGEKALSSNVGNLAKAHYFLAVCALQDRDQPKALRHFDASIQADPTDGEPFLRRGVLYQAAGELSKALADVQRAISLTRAPERLPQLRSLEGAILYQLGRFAEAEKSFSMARRNETERTRSDVALWMCYVQQRKFGLALFLARSGCESQPKNATMHAFYARTLLHWTDVRSARKEAETAIKLNDNDTQGWGTLAIAHWMSGDYEAANRAFINANIRGAKGDHDLRHALLLATCPNEKERNAAYAVQIIEFAIIRLKRPSDRAAVLAVLACAQAQQGQFAEALTSLKSSQAIVAEHKLSLAGLDHLQKLFEQRKPYLLDPLAPAATRPFQLEPLVIVGGPTLNVAY